MEALQEHWHLADVCFFNQGQDLGAAAMTFSPRECDFGVKGEQSCVEFKSKSKLISPRCLHYYSKSQLLRMRHDPRPSYP